jgi:hypothetical protein
VLLMNNIGPTSIDIIEIFGYETVVHPKCYLINFVFLSAFMNLFLCACCNITQEEMSQLFTIKYIVLKI